MDTRKIVAVIFGGRSGEHEVSLRSASSVVREADKAKYRIIPIAISKDGKWLSPAESAGLLTAEARISLGSDSDALSTERFTLSADSGLGAFISSDGAETLRFDVAFPVIHGTHGEDGTIQGLFELADVPYVGCGVLSSSSGMDKVFMKRLFSEAGLPICSYRWFLRNEWNSSKSDVISRVEELGYPCFVKPANLGSSVGVSRADDRASLEKAVEMAAQFDRKIIVEECLEMREIECAVLGNDYVEPSLLGEYIVKDESKKFLDYTEKYGATGNNEFVVPADLPVEVASTMRTMAVDAFKAVDGSGLARVDFFLVGEDRILVNEINTMPGLTDASGYPKMWATTGLPLRELIDKLIGLAFDRHADRKQNKTSL